MVTINRNIYTPYASTNSVSPGASPSVSNTVSGEPDYSEINELLRQSEKEVAKAKKDLDKAEARLRKATEHLENYREEARKKYGADRNNWPYLVDCEARQLRDFAEACALSVDVARAAYDHALETHRKYTEQLAELIRNGCSIPTASGSVTGSNNAPTATTGDVPYYPNM